MSAEAQSSKEDLHLLSFIFILSITIPPEHIFGLKRLYAEQPLSDYYIFVSIIRN